MGTRRVVSSAKVPRLGPYSQAVRVDKTVYVAGQPGLNPRTGKAAGDTFETQARQAFKNLQTILEDAGSNLSGVVRATCYMTDEANFTKMNEVFAEFFPESPPVRSTPIVGLPKGLLFSIDAVAITD
jgi:2-iminobutanoate/2-iminopropanoate deaminase